MPRTIQSPVPYCLSDHKGFAEEWGLHKKSSEWWYATGVLHDEAGKLYSYQFTLLRIRAAFLRPYILMLALTDFETGRHRYRQRITLSTKGIEILPERLRFGADVLLEKHAEFMRLRVSEPDFSLALDLVYGKGAVWHCDNGALRMGVDRPDQTTLYYSYPNMPTQGEITLDGKTMRVSGKTWFDKQGGPYALLKPETHWEWFSLRFFDEEEMMLFSFPQDDYRDGTYIRKDGSYERLQSYEIKAMSFITTEGNLTYANAWKVHVPNRKQEQYEIRPLIAGQMNLGYYELLAGIYDNSSELVGHCFVELLPGARNRKFSTQLFQRAEK
ncbi:MAG: lipocalin-like domain-containing protein [Christensenella sp.]|nr:lipocalin-like domain-containing protein [Christensenella sp.]